MPYKDKEKERAWRLANREKVNAKSRRYRLANPEYMKVWHRNHDLANREKDNARKRNYWNKNPDKKAKKNLRICIRQKFGIPIRLITLELEEAYLQARSFRQEYIKLKKKEELSKQTI